MAPTPGPSPPVSPTLTSSTSSISTPHPPLPPQDYGRIVHSIHRRSIERGLSENASMPWGSKGDAGGGSPDARGGEGGSFEADLRLAAEIGQALLKEKTALQQRLESVERANQKLLDRLSTSVRENAQLQRRLEETVGNLEQADSSNRALLVSLEEDRKTISRLSADSGKLVATTATLKDLQRSYDDVRQELVSERKRSSAAEAKAKKIESRANELEDRMKIAIADLEEMRQDKVLRSRKSGDALAKARAKYARNSDDERSGPSISASTAADTKDNIETTELLKLVENLVTENNLLRSESMELHGLLESTREEQLDHRSPLVSQEVVPEEDEDDVRRAENDEDDTPAPFAQRRLSMLSAGSVPPESITSPSLSHSGFEFEPHRTPLSPNSLLYQRTGGASPFSSQTSELNRPFRSDDDSASMATRLPTGVRRSNSQRGCRPPPASSHSTGMLSGGKLPFGRGRGHNRRSLSMDISSSMPAGQGPSPLVEPESAPTSPNPNYSPSTRPASIFSNASEDPDSSIRPRRHHRPLSLSLGPSLFPDVPEDDSARPLSPFTRSQGHRRRSSHTPLPVSESLGSAPSGLSLSSPPKVHMDSTRRPPRERAPATSDCGTQTSPPASPRANPYSPLPSVSGPFSTASTPHRSPHSTDYGRSPSLSPKPAASRSHTSVSDVSEERLFEAHSATPGSTPFDQRTAALGQLTEHVVKLLARLQAADVATQSKRLAKQNLPGGDVKHVASANLKDLVHEVDSMRDRFRRVLEQERAAVVRDPSNHALLHGAESLVSRREFVALVKLLRDLLFEASRLRSLVNRVQLDPSLASRLAELDDAQSVDDEISARPSIKNGGLLAPLSRLFGATLSPGEHPTLSNRSSSAQLRASVKRGGSSAVSSATVNVEFGQGAVRASSTDPTPPRDQPAAMRPAPPRRDLSSIFAGSTTRTTADPWVVLPASTDATAPTASRPMAPVRTPGLVSAASTASSYLPFGRMLASYRPAMSSTTNAVLDSIPHAPRDNASTDEPAPTLLERQLRPRGLSDSSIRSSFLAHGVANPHHRVLTPATLALSSEPTRISTPVVVADASSRASSPAPESSVKSSGGLGAISALKQQLNTDDGLLSASSGSESHGSISRRTSMAKLRAKPSQSRLREQVVAPSSAPIVVDRTSSTWTEANLSTSASPSAPSLASTSPAPIQISPPSPAKGRPALPSTDSTSSSPVNKTGTTTAPGSLFGTLWGGGWSSQGGLGVEAPRGPLSESLRERTRIGRD
ncbi:hypothetical protein JCM10212_005511 [Sporobolomyces blumeae]